MDKKERAKHAVQFLSVFDIFPCSQSKINAIQDVFDNYANREDFI